MSQEAEVAPQFQDDFDIAEEELSTVDVPDRPENQVNDHTCTGEGSLWNSSFLLLMCSSVTVSFSLWDISWLEVSTSNLF